MSGTRVPTAPSPNLLLLAQHISATHCVSGDGALQQLWGTTQRLRYPISIATTVVDFAGIYVMGDSIGLMIHIHIW